jgi:branched-chain amino acid transport system ATP-binding protein
VTTLLHRDLSRHPAAREGERRDAVLTIRDVGKRFNEIVALKNINLTVEPGDVHGIAGPNGAGKTTLFNVIAGSSRGTGEIMFEGTEIMGLKPHQICRRGIARTFQIPILFGSMTVAENVGVGAHFGGHLGRGERDAVLECLEFVGLGKKTELPAHRVDLLDKKLTMLAAALATQPSLLLLDEPMGGLAPSEISQFGELIMRLNQERHMTIVVIEHLIKKLVELSNKLMILYHGEEIALGSPREVVSDPRVIDLYLGTDQYT